MHLIFGHNLIFTIILGNIKLHYKLLLPNLKCKKNKPYEKYLRNSNLHKKHH
jgi:hypothetical protein